MLEKKKDYRLRAQNYHMKERTLQVATSFLQILRLISPAVP